MKKHKQIRTVFLFMLLFVQSGLYFTGAQLLADCRKGEEITFVTGEDQKEVSITAPLTARDVNQLWTGGKKVHFSLTDISQKASYQESDQAEQRIYGCREKTGFDRREKYDLSDGLRAPPEQTIEYERQHKQNLSKL